MLKVLMCTCEWPSRDYPFAAPFVVRQVDYLKKRGVDVRVFAFRGKANPFNYFKAARQFRKIRKEFNPDVVHAQWGQSVLPTLPKITPLVITYRGDDLEGVVNKNGRYDWRSSLLKWIGRWVSRYADQIMIVSPHLRSKLNTRVPVHVIPSGLAFDSMPRITKEEAKRSLKLPLDKKIVIFPSNPADPRKNLDLVQQVFERLRPAEREQLQLHIVFGVSHEEMLVNLRAADFLLFTSLHEGSPNVVKEALGNDVAVISVPVGDVPFRLPAIPGCFVSASYNADELTEAFRKALVFDYSNYNLKPFIQDLDEDLLIEKVIAIYKAAL